MRIGPFGVWEILIVLTLVLLLFGPRKLPELAKSFGQAYTAFRRSMNDLSRNMEQELRDAEVEAKAEKQAGAAAAATSPGPGPRVWQGPPEAIARSEELTAGAPEAPAATEPEVPADNEVAPSAAASATTAEAAESEDNSPTPVVAPPEEAHERQARS